MVAESNAGGLPGAWDYVKERFSAVALATADRRLEWRLPFVSGPEGLNYTRSVASHVSLSNGNFEKSGSGRDPVAR